jgi:hypothetical protein
MMTTSLFRQLTIETSLESSKPVFDEIKNILGPHPGTLTLPFNQRFLGLRDG